MWQTVRRRPIMWAMSTWTEGTGEFGHAVPAGTGLWSIGHSTHTLDRFMGLVDQHGIEVVADVRSSPFSRFNPQFNRRVVERALEDAGKQYLFLGEELGGRPDGEQFYDFGGHVLYGRLAKSPLFESGLVMLTNKAEQSRVAIMCSEDAPADCHRFLLITRVIHDWDIGVTHIRGDGTTQRTEEIHTYAGWMPEYEQPSFLDESVNSSWRSIRPVGPAMASLGQLEL